MKKSAILFTAMFSLFLVGCDLDNGDLETPVVSVATTEFTAFVHSAEDDNVELDKMEFYFRDECIEKELMTEESGAAHCMLNEDEATTEYSVAESAQVALLDQVTFEALDPVDYSVFIENYEVSPYHFMVELNEADEVIMLTEHYSS